jgi:hypothetical protein
MTPTEVKAISGTIMLIAGITGKYSTEIARIGATFQTDNDVDKAMRELRTVQDTYVIAINNINTHEIFRNATSVADATPEKKEF